MVIVRVVVSPRGHHKVMKNTQKKKIIKSTNVQNVHVLYKNSSNTFQVNRVPDLSRRREARGRDARCTAPHNVSPATYYD